MRFPTKQLLSGVLGVGAVFLMYGHAHASYLPFSDNFSGNNYNGWGSNWTVLNSSYASDFIAAGFGYVNVPYVNSTNQRVISLNGSWTSTDSPDIQTQVKWQSGAPLTGSTGARYYSYLVARKQPDPNNAGQTCEYRARISYTLAGGVKEQFVKVVDGTETAIGTEADSTYGTYTNEVYNVIKTQVIGTSPATLNIKVWNDGDAEPTNWDYTATDTTSCLSQLGTTGVITRLGGQVTSNPAAFDYADYSVSSP